MAGSLNIDDLGGARRPIRGRRYAAFAAEGGLQVVAPIEPIVHDAILARAPVRADRLVPIYWLKMKRATDIIVAGCVLVMSAPVIAAAALGIMIVSPGSPFFHQQRVGKDGRLFRLWKLRTMVEGAHLVHDDMHPLSEVDGPVFKLRDDPRLHPLGKFLRRTSIDELPNLVNVLFGEMSVVGPRPPLQSEVLRYDAFARRRLSVKPGITCLWQISGRSNVTFERWMELDNRYIDSWTPWSDIGIMIRTIPAVLRGEGAH